MYMQYTCTMSMDSYTLESAITSMKSLSAKGIPFSFSFMKLNGTRSKVYRAAIRKQAKSSKVKNSFALLEYVNVDTDECKHCYLPLLMSFNNKPIRIRR